MTSLSITAASAFRVGMPAWKPLGLALKTKLLLSGVFLVGVLLIAGWVMNASSPSNAPPDVKGHMILLDSCETPKAAKKKPVQNGLDVKVLQQKK